MRVTISAMAKRTAMCSERWREQWGGDSVFALCDLRAAVTFLPRLRHTRTARTCKKQKRTLIQTNNVLAVQ